MQMCVGVLEPVVGGGLGRFRFRPLGVFPTALPSSVTRSVRSARLGLRAAKRGGTIATSQRRRTALGGRRLQRWPRGAARRLCRSRHICIQTVYPIPPKTTTPELPHLFFTIFPPFRCPPQPIASFRYSPRPIPSRRQPASRRSPQSQQRRWRRRGKSEPTCTFIIQ